MEAIVSIQTVNFSKMTYFSIKKEKTNILQANELNWLKQALQNNSNSSNYKIVL